MFSAYTVNETVTGSAGECIYAYALQVYCRTFSMFAINDR